MEPWQEQQAEVQSERWDHMVAPLTAQAQVSRRETSLPVFSRKEATGSQKSDPVAATVVLIHQVDLADQARVYVLTLVWNKVALVTLGLVESVGLMARPVTEGPLVSAALVAMVAWASSVASVALVARVDIVVISTKVVGLVDMVDPEANLVDSLATVNLDRVGMALMFYMDLKVWVALATLKNKVWHLGLEDPP